MKHPIFYITVPLKMSASELAVYHKNRQRMTGRSIFCSKDIKKMDFVSEMDKK